MATPAMRPAPRDYHYVMTVQAPGGAVCTLDGTLAVDLDVPDATRHGAYQHLKALAVQKLGRDGAVIVWSFEPNEL